MNYAATAETASIEKNASSAIADFARLARHCQSFKGADNRRALLQLAVTAVAFAVLIACMMVALASDTPIITAILMLPAAGLLVRLFIVQHDCGHSSYFSSNRANDLTGRLISLFTLTPYYFWKRSHNVHHAASGNLDQRGTGAVDTLTLREYLALPFMKRLGYRLYRNPFIMLVLGTPAHVLLIQRIPFLTIAPFFESYRAVPAAETWKSVILLNIAATLFYGTLSMVFGWQIVASVFLPVIIVSSWIGGWMFFVQHQFEQTYWERQDQWKFREAAVGGSSYYVLPSILHWFTGNIGLHHVHHLCSAIPNYRLQECLDADSNLQKINRMTIRDSLKSLKCSVWDEEIQRMVGFPARL